MADSEDRNLTSLSLREKDADRKQRRGAAGDDAVRRFAVDAARLLGDHHCEDVLILDVRGASDLTDYIIIASGTSDRQILAVSGHVEQEATTHGMARYGREIDAPATWLVLDFVDVIVHLFEPQTRAHYDLEMLWGDAPKVEWQRGEESSNE
jgi:ribosome-associated protein